MKIIKVRNKNALLELLKDEVDFEKIILADDLIKDDLIKDILLVARSRNISIEKISHRKMIKGRSGTSRESLVGFMISKNIQSLKNLLDDLLEKNLDPFFLLINRVGYTSNIGIIARTAFAAGVNGLIFQGEEDRFLNEETLHFSMGAIARIPLVKMSIFESLKELQKNGVKTFSLQMGGTTYFKENLSGPVAFVLGDEGEGLSEKVSSRCYKKISIPMRQDIDSLNVGVSAAIILYEKVRQENLLRK
ncbi:RNA methyltransferase [Patescibacteria group bacterium]|nr:RNA methyltransferase [Patescibacteria group bacterium]MBU1563895.1 RNA methyltransferase [Patescibacteria group bacterium]